MDTIVTGSTAFDGIMSGIIASSLGYRNDPVCCIGTKLNLIMLLLLRVSEKLRVPLAEALRICVGHCR